MTKKKKKIFTHTTCFIFALPCCVNNTYTSVLLMCLYIVFCVLNTVSILLLLSLFFNRHLWNIIRMSRFDWNQRQCCTECFVCRCRPVFVHSYIVRSNIGLKSASKFDNFIFGVAISFKKNKKNNNHVNEHVFNIELNCYRCKIVNKLGLKHVLFQKKDLEKINTRIHFVCMSVQFIYFFYFEPSFKARGRYFTTFRRNCTELLLIWIIYIVPIFL